MKLLVALFVAASLGLAQTTTGPILGTVGQAGATVTVSDPSRGMVRSVVADSDGNYRISGLMPGRYEVKVEGITRRVEINADSHLQLNFDVHSKASVDVRETLKAVEPESPALGFTLDRERIEKLPLNRRDFLQLALLLPGVMPPVQGSELSTGGSFAMNAGGAREEFNNFTLDGRQ